MRRRKAAPLFAALVAVVMAVAPSTARPASAADPLRLAVDATYTVAPDAERVRVSLQVTATNLEAPTATRIFFYPEILIGVQPDAVQIRASDSAGSLTTISRRRPAYTSVRIVLRSSLLYQQTARFEVRYDLPGGEPRSSSPIRVGQAFATFDVWAWGDRGRSSVEVRLPPGFRSHVIGDTLAVEQREDGRRLRAEPTDPFSFYAIVDAENPAAYARTRISLAGGVELVLLAWPEDGVWQTTVATTLRSGMPVLRDLIGLAWPVRHDLEVRERYTPALEGYAGVFYEDESIDVSEDLDPLVIVHEASHAWFNADLFTERWIYEGLAQEYAWRVVTSVGGDAPAPTRPSPDDPAAVALTDWSHPGVIRDQETEDYERYGYEASWWVIHEISAVVGVDRMRFVFESAQRNTTAYLGAGPAEQYVGSDGLFRFYDLIEDVTQPPSERIDRVLRTFVVTPAQAKLLDARADARAAYRDLLAAGDGWLPPWSVRRPMEAWQFPMAMDRIAEATAVLDLRDQVAAAADALGLQPDETLRSAYESAGSGLEPATGIARRELDALAGIDAARVRLLADRDLLTTIGLLDAEPERPYEAARAAFDAGDLDLAVSLAASSVTMIVGAQAVGQERVVLGLAVAIGVVILLVAGGLLIRMRRRPAPAETPTPAGIEPYATLAADRSRPPESPAEVPLEGGDREGGTTGER